MDATGAGKPVCSRGLGRTLHGCLRAFGGPAHPSFIRALRLQAYIHHDLEENDVVQRLIAEADSLAQDIPDLDSREASALAEARASIQSALGDLDGAAQSYATAARLITPKETQETAEHVRLISLQADVARRRRDFAVVRGLWDRVIEYRKQFKNRDNGEYILAVTEAAITRLDQGDVEGATSLARDADAGRDRGARRLAGPYGAADRAKSSASTRARTQNHEREAADDGPAV